MNYQKLDALGIATKEGLSRFSNKEALYNKYLIKFIHEPTYALLQEAMCTQDAKEAFKAAHTIKGIAGNLSIVPLYKTLTALCDVLRAASDMKLAGDLFAQFSEEYTHCVSVIAEASRD